MSSRHPELDSGSSHRGKEGSPLTPTLSRRARGICAAFTLAEVLITLAIIGVVATMTIPTLISNYEKKVTIVRLQKVYSTLVKVFKLSEVNNGNFATWNTKSEIGATEFFERYWAPYLASPTVCKTYQECGYDESHPWQTLGGERKNSIGVVDNSDDNRISFYLADGTFISLSASLYVDLNGSKGPNIYGKDFFVFKYGNFGVKPADNNWDKERVLNYCSIANNYESSLCAARIILYDNWEIKDDYPW